MSTNPDILIFGTQETKAEELAFLRDACARTGLRVEAVDVSLRSGRVLDGSAKLAAMQAATEAGVAAAKALAPARVAIGLGGGTGGEIVLNILRGLPSDRAKLLVTTLPFDPRPAVADSSIVLIPTVVDISGLGAAVKRVLADTAAMAAGLCGAGRRAVAGPSIAVTALGATEAAAAPLVSELRARDADVTVLHSNGYGGAALVRMIDEGAVRALVELTPHELTRMMIGGAHVDMPRRFRAAAEAAIPQIVLPGALNFIGLGPLTSLSDDHRARAHYAHSGNFTHVKLDQGEMRRIADALIAQLNEAPGTPALIVPMGGFSHQDAPGGEIEDPDLRGMFLERVTAGAGPNVEVVALDAHISAPEVRAAILARLPDMYPAGKETRHG